MRLIVATGIAKPTPVFSPVELAIAAFMGQWLAGGYTDRRMHRGMGYLGRLGTWSVVILLVTWALAFAIPIALAIAWAFSTPLGRRVREIAAVANRYSAGEAARTNVDYGNDELGTVASGLCRPSLRVARRPVRLRGDVRPSREDERIEHVEGRLDLVVERRNEERPPARPLDRLDVGVRDE